MPGDFAQTAGLLLLGRSPDGPPVVAEVLLHESLGQVLDDQAFLLHLQADAAFDLVAADRAVAAVELAKLLLGDATEVGVQGVEALLVADAASVDESAESEGEPVLVPGHHGSAGDARLLDLTVVDALHDRAVDGPLEGHQPAHVLVALGDANAVGLAERPEGLAWLRELGQALTEATPALHDALLSEQRGRLDVSG